MAVLAGDTRGYERSRLAQEFAHAAARHFRETIWVGCRNRAMHSIVGELAWRLGCSSADSEAALRDRIGRVIEEHRLLLILDDVSGEIPAAATPEGRGSVLVTRVDSDSVPRDARLVEIQSGVGHSQLVIPSAEQDCNCCEPLPSAVATTVLSNWR